MFCFALLLFIIITDTAGRSLCHVVAGVSYAFLYAPSFVLIRMYFDKWRTLANGLAVAGASVGQLVIPQMLTFLLYEYNLMWTLIVYSAVCLNGIVAGALLRPVSFYKKRSKSMKAEAALKVKESGNCTSELQEKDTDSRGDGAVEGIYLGHKTSY